MNWLLNHLRRLNMAGITQGNWTKLAFADAMSLCENQGFTLMPFDLFDMETKIYVHRQAGLSFKLKQGMGDTICFYIQTFKNDIECTYEEFRNTLVEYNTKK